MSFLRDKKRRRRAAAAADTSGGAGYLMDTLDRNKKWTLGPKILTHDGIGLPVDEVQEVCVDMGRESSEKPQGQHFTD